MSSNVLSGLKHKTIANCLRPDETCAWTLDKTIQWQSFPMTITGKYTCIYCIYFAVQVFMIFALKVDCLLRYIMYSF